MSKQFIESIITTRDEQFEQPLRPARLIDFLGQNELCEQVSILIEAAKMRGDVLGHCLFSGPPGLGKTTLSHIIAEAMGTKLVTTSGPALERASDLAGILNSLNRGDVLFIDEVHRIPKAVEEYLYSAIEDFVLDIIVDSAASAKSVRLPLQPFTLVGATTRLGLLSAPFRSRFSFIGRLAYYEPRDLQQIVLRSSKIFGLELDEQSSFEIAKRSRGTPRIANNLVRWVRDYCVTKAGGNFSKVFVSKALDMLAIDEVGLEEMDVKILSTIEMKFSGGPVGLNTLAIAVGEEPRTLEEVYEPFLIGLGFLQRTPRGREITHRGRSHLLQSKKNEENNTR